mmetsp:Transcript_9656/g.23649  ORF Transcript_9656/g.23649 Transcript_9656/m.23649 type:complete len:415 (+) Transcript_9656:70-1314(+)
MGICFRCWMLVRSYLFLWSVVASLPSCRCFRSTNNHRATKKAHDKFARWTNEHREERRENPQLLWIDGNNVRGVGKFEWNAVELQQKVVRFCHKYEIPNAIVVWDHGNDKSSHSTRYRFNEPDDGSPVALVDGAVGDDEFCVNLLVLFSGLRQRADDVIVRESNHLIASSAQNVRERDTKLDWASLAFVTNDRDLNYKLRQQSTSASISIRLGRRRRRDAGRKYDKMDRAGKCDPKENRKASAKPLFCDSTGFVNLLRELPTEYDMGMSATDAEASESIDEARSSIRSCSQSQRRGYNPRREKTWERCVQAETFRRLLGQSLPTDAKQLSDVEMPPEEQEDENGIFVANYLRELQSTRGFSSAVQATGKGASTGNDSIVEQFTPFLGPARLDKYQRRLLDRYNALARNEGRMQR